jgi:ribosomal protein L35
MKTNKSFLKRLRVTSTGKVLGRRGGRNHFNAKESRSTQLAAKRGVEFHFSNKTKSRFLINAK